MLKIERSFYRVEAHFGYIKIHTVMVEKAQLTNLRFYIHLCPYIHPRLFNMFSLNISLLLCKIVAKYIYYLFNLLVNLFV